MIREPLDRDAAAALLGVRPKTIDSYRDRGIFPEPDGHVGRSPFWYPETLTGFVPPKRTGRPASKSIRDEAKETQR